MTTDMIMVILSALSMIITCAGFLWKLSAQISKLQTLFEKNDSEHKSICDHIEGVEKRCDKYGI